MTAEIESPAPAAPEDDQADDVAVVEQSRQCGCCGLSAALDQPTCAGCGEASWRGDVDSDAAPGYPAKESQGAPVPAQSRTKKKK